MNRRARTLLALGGALAALAAVGGVVAWHPWQRPTAEGDGAAPPSASFVALSKMDDEDLRSIELVGPAGTIELDAVEGAWKIVAPVPLEVKPGPLNDLLYSVTTLSSERIVEERPEDLAPYGLDPPAVTVRLTLATGEVRELYLGDMTPAGDTYYLMVQGDPRVFTVREHHGTYFNYQIQDLWAGARTPVDAADIVRVVIRLAGKPRLEIARTEALAANDVEFRGTSLSVVYPWASSPKPVDTGTLSSFAQGLGSLQGEVAVDVNPADLARYGLDAPSAELLLRDGKGTTLHIVTGKVDRDALFLRFAGDPTVYAGSAQLLEFLDVDPERFVNKLAMIVKIDRVDRLAVTAGGVRHVLEIRRRTPGSEEGASWLVDGGAVTEKAFKDFYVNAVSLQADALHDEPVSGAADVTFEFTLNAGPVRTYAVRFVPNGQEFYAVVKGGRSDLLVNRQQLKALLQRLEALAKTAGG